MSLAVVILNYRTALMTLNCLESLAPQIEQIPDARVIVVDNASNDGSAEHLRDESAARNWHWLRIITLPTNVGFSAGNNRGLNEIGHSEFVLLLNSDTLVHERCLEHCMQVMRSDQTIGTMSCLLLNREGTPQVTARRFSPPVRQYVCALGLPWRIPSLFGWANPEDKWDRRTTRRDVDWICGAFMFCRADVLKQLGGLDEDFFFYGEDYELCHRIHRAGYRIHYDPAVATTHFGGGSSQIRQQNLELLRHSWRGRYLIYRKIHGRVATWILRGIDLANYGGTTLIRRIIGKHESSRHSASIFSLLAGRL